MTVEIETNNKSIIKGVGGVGGGVVVLLLQFQ